MSKRNIVFWAMVASMTLGYMPWYNFSALSKQIASEFRLTAGDTGFILAAFQLGYVIVVGVTGRLADKISMKRIIFIATLCTGVFGSLFAFAAQGKFSILALRLLTGLSAGAIYAPGMALLSGWFPSRERGKVLGAYTGALVAAYAGGYLVASSLAGSFGWRAGILWTSLPVLLAALIVLLFVEDPTPEPEVPVAPIENNIDSRNADSSAALPAPEGGFAGPVLITSGYAGHMWELYAFWGWIGPFLVASACASGMDPCAAVRWGGAWAAVIILMGAPASWLWGVVSDKKGRTWAVIVAGSLSLSFEFFIGFLYGHSLALIIFSASWIGFWVIADSGVYKAGLTEMVAPGVKGVSLGIQSVVGFGVTIISPAVFGLILERYNGPVEPTGASIWGPAFVVLGLGSLLVPISGFALRRHRQAGLMAGGKK